MELLAVIAVPALAAWSISVGHRCISERVNRALRALCSVMLVALAVALAVGGMPACAALVACAAFVLAIEALIGVGAIPSAHSFQILFEHLPLDVRIVAPGGREVYRTNAAMRLDNTTLARLARTASRAARGDSPSASTGASAPTASSPAAQPATRIVPKSARVAGSAQGQPTSVRFDEFPQTVFKLYRLHAGTAVLAENTGELDSLRQRLEQQNDQLSRQNEMLRRNSAMRGLLYRQQRERELSERVSADLAATATQISALLDNRLSGEGSQGEAERLEQLNLVKVLVAYSKRKGMLALAGAESDTMQPAQLETIAREAMADLGSIGIECAILVAVSKPVAMAAVNVFYDSFYDCILSVLPRAHPVLMVYVGDAQGSGLVVRVSIECAIGLTRGNAVELIPQLATSADSWTAVQEDIAQDLRIRLAKRAAASTVRLEDGIVSVVVKAGEDAPGGERALVGEDATNKGDAFGENGDSQRQRACESARAISASAPAGGEGSDAS